MRPSLTLLLAGFVLACGGARAPADEPTGAVKHHVILMEYAHGQSRLVDVSPEGKVLSEHKVGGLSVCFQPLADGHVLYAHHTGDKTGVREVDREGKVVWEYISKSPEVLGCERLPNGNTLLAEQFDGGKPKATEVNSKGEVVSSIQMTTTEGPAHRQVRCVHKLANGNILAAHEAEGVIREYDAEGKTVWEYGGLENAFDAVRLPNGNTLMGGGTQKRVIEVSPEKKVVWEFKAEDAPELNLTWITSLQVLNNGNVVVANFLRGQEGKGAHAFEVTRDKKVVWTYADHAGVVSLTMVRVLDD
jgi:hypothetical protein